MVWNHIKYSAVLLTSFKPIAALQYHRPNFFKFDRDPLPCIALIRPKALGVWLLMGYNTDRAQFTTPSSNEESQCPNKGVLAILNASAAKRCLSSAGLSACSFRLYRFEYHL